MRERAEEAMTSWVAKFFWFSVGFALGCAYCLIAGEIFKKPKACRDESRAYQAEARCSSPEHDLYLEGDRIVCRCTKRESGFVLARAGL